MSTSALGALSENTSGQQVHRDAEILLSLVGVGIVNGATMLAEAGRLLRDRDYQGLRVLSGTAPVRRSPRPQTRTVLDVTTWAERRRERREPSFLR